MKIVINSDFGGFGLSPPAWREYLRQRYGEFREEGPNDHGFHTFFVNNESIWDCDLERDDPVLVKVVEEMGADASGPYASLKVVEIPAYVDWYIEEYDGREWIAETHRTWR